MKFTIYGTLGINALFAIRFLAANALIHVRFNAFWYIGDKIDVIIASHIPQNLYY